MTNSPENVAAEALVARIEELLPKVAAGPWEVVSDLPCYAIAAGQHRVVQTANQNNYRHFGATERWLGIESREHAAWIALLNPENVKVLLSALHRQSPASHANTVKALEWRGSADEPYASGLVGSYKVSWSNYANAFLLTVDGCVRRDTFPTAEAAQAAAQADYERRILSALTASPSPAGAPAPATEAPGLLDWTVENVNGKQWRITGPGGQWTMKPEGLISADDAKAICSRIVAALGSAPEGFTWIFQPVRVKGEDFSYDALCLCSFPKSSGKVRYIVEDNGRIFVQRREQLTFREDTALPALSNPSAPGEA
jgi:hypothetical protein